MRAEKRMEADGRQGLERMDFIPMCRWISRSKRVGKLQHYWQKRSKAAIDLFKSARFSSFLFRRMSHVKKQLHCCPLSFDDGNGHEHQWFKSLNESSKVNRNATEECNGGAERTAWEALLERTMENYVLVWKRWTKELLFLYWILPRL